MEFPEATDRGFSAVQCGGADAFHGLWRSGIALASGFSGLTWSVPASQCSQVSARKSALVNDAEAVGDGEPCGVGFRDTQLG